MTKIIKKIIIAFLLLPSACIVYKKKILFHLIHSPRCLFGNLIKENNQINKRGILYNAIVFYPYCIGIKIYHLGFLAFCKLCIKKIYSLIIIKNNTSKYNYSKENLGNITSAKPLPPISLKTLIRLIENNDIKVVSFDIFDTLLTRPIIKDPREIFYLIAERINKKYNLNFINIRWDVEKQMKDPYATINDIYKYIQNKYKIPYYIIEEIKQEELQCEYTLLQARQDMLKLCQVAHSLGKRIIATSDMYIPSKFLLKILHDKGFKDIEKVYVSSEFKARKTDNGALFDIVIENEKINKNSILHIGDNYISDVIMPLKKGISAIHYPSICQQCKEYGGDIYQILVNIAEKSPLYGLVLGQSLEYCFDKSKSSPTNLDRCSTISEFGNLILAPLATILTIKSISIAKLNNYSHIYYASRDGCLPYQIHKAIEKYIDSPEAIYFQAGRRAYFPFLIEGSFLEYVLKNTIKDKQSLTIADIIKTYFQDDSNYLLTKLNKNEQETIFFNNILDTTHIIKKIDSDILHILNNKRENALLYYNSIFSSKEKNSLIFDIGYSGSISLALSRILKKPIDKLYCWQTAKNIKLDVQYKTKTFTLMTQDNNYVPFNLVLEELFSPCSGGTIGFSENGQPIHENIKITTEMLNTLEQLHNQCIEYAINTMKRFSNYANYLSNSETSLTLKICKQLFQTKPLTNRSIFKSIIFPDPIYLCEDLTLEQKLDFSLQHSTSFSATGFEDNKNILHPQDLCYKYFNTRVAIHIHIFNSAIAQEIASYLFNIPVEFDLFITYVNKEDINFLTKIFNKNIISHLKYVNFILTPNRGRDVAPWIIGTAAVQNNYDLFCHAHTKESKHFIWGQTWRRYLLDNLFRPESFNCILAAFSQNTKLGMLFPKIFPKVKEAMTLNNSNLGTCTIDEYNFIKKILKQMKMSPNYARSEQFFSSGTMFWYRPQALKPLFTCGLSYEDFPQEPIGIDGSLAHALERIPPVICKRLDYEISSLTLFQPTLSS